MRDRAAIRHYTKWMAAETTIKHRSAQVWRWSDQDSVAPDQLVSGVSSRSHDRNCSCIFNGTYEEIPTCFQGFRRVRKTKRN